MQTFKNTFFLILGIVIIAWSFYWVLNKPALAKYQQITDNQQLTINNKTILVEIANTDAKREQGLSGRASLNPGSGMLFVFERPGLYGFWMKEMNFSLDIVWIDENGQVINIDKALEPETYPQVFYPVKPVKYVLELNAGESVKMGIDTDSKLSFSAQN